MPDIPEGGGRGPSAGAAARAATREYPWLRHYDPGVPRSLEYPRATVLQLFEEQARHEPGRVALIFFGRAVHFGELAAHVRRVAAGLAALGVRPGDRVALLLPNCPQYVIAFYALVRLGAVVVPVNPLSTERELEYVFRDAGVVGVVALDLLAARVEAVRQRLEEAQPAQGVFAVYAAIPEFLPFPLNILFPLKQKPSAGVREVRRRGVPFRVLLRGGPDLKVPADVPGTGAEPAAVDPDRDVAVIIYTGGTTGRPKGVMLSHRALVVNARQVIAWGQVGPDDRVLAALPLFHGFGMSVCMNTPLIGGGSAVLMPRWDPGQALRLIQRHRPTIFIGVPTMYIGLINHPDRGRHDLTSLRGCFAGAAALPAEVKRRFEELTGGKLLEGYGLTEAVTAKCANPYRGLNKTGSIGIPFPDTVMEVVDVETGEKVLPAGEVGEIRLRSPDLMLGYWNRPEETAQAIRGGWLYTGDLGRMDEDGFFYIVERKKDLIITGGFNVYPKEVEEVLFSHPAVKEACVVGVPDEYRGEAVKAFVVLKENASATAEDIIAFAKLHLTPYKVPRHVEFVTELPRSAIGKVLRRVLRERAAEGDEGSGTGGAAPGRR
ncbi:MAG: long-chain fatty acid--CoA ligase [Firmicutes bacterium]|nr:long-chain fatty acid--CoA ligase [Bacillota bacterium]